MSDRPIREIQIDELVINGPRSVDAAALRMSVERELARLADGGRALLVGRDLVRAEAPAQTSRSHGPGRAIAQAVLRGVRT